MPSCGKVANCNSCLESTTIVLSVLRLLLKSWILLEKLMFIMTIHVVGTACA